MCGICGEVRFNNEQPEPNIIRRMMNCMTRRGPDGDGLVVRGNVALGHQRLKIIDLSDAAQQPMVDSMLGMTIAFNGAIYNYPDLRKELTGLGYQ